jgi:photosystem II stability/assembly factor-like uncharacterized protein
MRGMKILLLTLLLAWSTALPAQQSGGTESAWIVQTSGLETNLRGVSAVYSSDPSGVRIPVVWASGSDGVILRSIDGSATWKQLKVAGGETLDFRGIRAFDEKTAYVMSSGPGEKSRIYKTTDGGETWEMQFTNSRPSFFLDALVCISRVECFALSDPVDGKFVVVSTHDGEKWRELPRDNMPAALQGEGAFAASNTSLAICGRGEMYFGTGGGTGGGKGARVFRSTDRGQTWSVAETPMAIGNASSGVFSIACAGDAIVAVGGDYKEPTRNTGVAAHSLDHGKTWTLAAQQPRGYRSAVARLDKTVLLTVGPNGEEFSDDQGRTWTPSDSLNLNAIAVLDPQNAWAVGPDGMIVRLNSARFAKRKK